MTYKDIYDKFLIEYDKATASASYPSFTQLEICTFLDKAYLALITQKLTGNNQRRVGFDGDIKSINDLRNLISVERISVSTFDTNSFAYNVAVALINNNIKVQYLLDAVLFIGWGNTDDDPSPILLKNTEGHVVMDETKGYTIGVDSRTGLIRSETCAIVSEDVAKKSFLTDVNYPRVKHPLVFLTPTQICVVLDPLKVERGEYFGDLELNIRYIITPPKFYTAPNNTAFLSTDNVAEELINLAVAFALENIESPRVQTKVQLNQLES